MKRKTEIKPCALLLMLMMSLSMYSQKTTEDDYATNNALNNKPEKKERFSERLVYGGNLGGYFGNISFVQINPMVGYRLTDWLVPGVGLNYLYAGNAVERQNAVGASIWTRAYIQKAFFLHTELEYLKLTARSEFYGTYRADLPVWFVGAGYQANGFGVMAMIDLIGDPDSPYSTPVFRVGGLIGF